MKKVLCIFFALMVVMSMFAMLGTTAVAGDIGDLPSNPGGGGTGTGTGTGGLLSWLKSITSEQLLNIPANAMADITTFIFQALRFIAQIFRTIGGLVGIGA